MRCVRALRPLRAQRRLTRRADRCPPDLRDSLEFQAFLGWLLTSSLRRADIEAIRAAEPPAEFSQAWRALHAWFARGGRSGVTIDGRAAAAVGRSDAAAAAAAAAPEAPTPDSGRSGVRTPVTPPRAAKFLLPSVDGGDNVAVDAVPRAPADGSGRPANGASASRTSRTSTTDLGGDELSESSESSAAGGPRTFACAQT